MIPILSAASAGNQEGAPAPSWNFPRTEDEGRRPPFYCLLLPVAPTIRLAAKRLRRRDPVPGWLMRLSSTTRRARRPGVPPPVPRRSPTTQCRRQNYQAFPNLVSHKAKRPESPQASRSGLPSPVPPSPVNPAPLSTPRDGFQRKGRSPSFGRFKEGLGGKSKSFPEFFFGIVKGDSFQIKRIPLDRQRAPARSPRSLPDGAGSKSRQASLAPSGRSASPGPQKTALPRPAEERFPHITHVPSADSSGSTPRGPGSAPP